MKWFLILWFVPVFLLGSWYGLSYHGMNFGFTMLSRQVHDLVFQIYGNVLGLEPESIPPLVFKAVSIDSLLVLSIVVFRYRKAIIKWLRHKHAGHTNQSLEKEESLSSAP